MSDVFGCSLLSVVHPRRPRAETAHRVDPVIEVALHHRRPAVAQLDGGLWSLDRTQIEMPAPRRVEPSVAADEATGDDPDGSAPAARIERARGRRIARAQTEALPLYLD